MSKGSLTRILGLLGVPAQVCQKSIALTYDFVISNRKPLRMVACDEAWFAFPARKLWPTAALPRAGHGSLGGAAN